MFGNGGDSEFWGSAEEMRIAEGAKGAGKETSACRRLRVPRAEGHVFG